MSELWKPTAERVRLRNEAQRFEIEYEKQRELNLGIPQGALDAQIGGNHYKDMAIQPVEFITANDLGFLEGNVVKYICRHHAKNGAQDIKKAIHYCQLILSTKYGE
jgi:Protein of unknwon function (DUF3310)